MGLFNKLKNALFEVEEVEVPVKESTVKIEPPKEEKKVEKKIEKRKNVYDDTYTDEEIFSDRNIFKAEKTFDFPVFDDKEFETMKEKEMNYSKEPEPPKTTGINLFDYDRPPKKPVVKQEAIKGRAYENKTRDLEDKKFHPSPVISPVYGVLDKNYKKEDIIVVEKKDTKKINVDDVRKKAFGTLEDDIEKSMMEHRKEEKEEKKGKTIDELLEETAFDSFELPKEEESEEEVILNNEDELETWEENNRKTEEEKVADDDTLETDVFKLIDSMYEKKEDE